MDRYALRLIIILFSLFCLLQCGQDYNSNSNDNGGELGIDCGTNPELCEAYIAMQTNHCFQCHGWSSYKTNEAWIASGLVIKNDPANSILIKKLKNAGGNMPQNYNPMTGSEYSAMRSWIQNM